MEIGLHWALLALELFTSVNKMINFLMPTSKEYMWTVKTMVQSRKELEAIYYLSKELTEYMKTVET